MTTYTIQVTCTPPDDNGGSPIVGYTAIATNGSDPNSPITGTATLPSVDLEVSGGLVYSVTMTASNGTYDSNVADAVNFIHPIPPDPVTTLWLSMSSTLTTVTATVTFVAPANNGGSTITGYNVDLMYDGIYDTYQGVTSPVVFTFTKPTVTTDYQVSVTASNSSGAGTAATSNIVTITI